MSLLASSARAMGFGGRTIKIPGASSTPGVIEGIPNLFAYWKGDETQGTTLVDGTGGRNATLSGTVVLGQAPVPDNSNRSVNFAGTGYAEIPHDAGLALSSFTLSFWFLLNSLPTTEAGRFALISKDSPGFNNGDLTIWVESDGDVVAQFQSATANVPIIGSVGVMVGIPYHVAVRADSTGFDLSINASVQGFDSGHTGGLVSNAQPLRFGAVEWLVQSPDGGQTPGVWPTDAVLLDGFLDEIALYSRRLTDAEILALSQYDTPPVANPDVFSIQEDTTAVLNLTANDTFVGPKSALNLEISTNPPTTWGSSVSLSHGTVTVRSDKNVDFAAGSVSQQEAQAFSYRITDAITQSNVGIVSGTVNDTPVAGSGDGLGGDLVWQFQPLASWIDGVAFNDRAFDNCLNLSRFTDPIATAGSSRQITAVGIGGGSAVRDCCYNRAPTGHPSIEIGTRGPGFNPGGIDVDLDIFPRPGPVARHLRYVIEVYLSGPTDPTTYRDQGVFPANATPNYQPWEGVFRSGGKFFNLIDANHTGVSCQYNWSGNGSLQDDRATWRAGWGAAIPHTSPQQFVGQWSVLENAWNRINQCEIGSVTESGLPTWVTDKTGINSRWFRVELELKLCTPGGTPSNATRGNSGFPRSWGDAGSPAMGDGFSKLWMTRDIDGTPSTRTLCMHIRDMVSLTRTNNIYLVTGLTRIGLVLWFGGTGASFGTNWPVHSWIRKMELYHYTEDDI